MSLRIAISCLLAGAVMIVAGHNVGTPWWWYLAGILMVAAFVPFLVNGPVEKWKRFAGIWCALAAVTALCTWSEALIFVKASPVKPSTMLFGSLFIYTVLAGVITLCAALLKVAPRQPLPPVAVPSAGRIALGVLGGGIAYLVYYYVFGALVFQLLTKPYYTGTGPLTDAVNTVRSLGLWFPAIQIGRGVLMTLGLLPIILGTRMNRIMLALYVGIVIWTIGGLAPLIPPNNFMPTELRLMHIGEIFTQNFALGMTVVFLLRGKDSKSEPSQKPLTVAA